MNLLPQPSGTRPRVACEISPQAVVAARSEMAASPLAMAARAALAQGAVAPGPRPGNVVDRVAVVAAIRSVMEQIDAKPNSRDADITLVVPDAAVRVLLLDFDSLPGKLAEALPIVKFRLKKLLPFDADDAMVSYQVMSSGKGGVRVLAVAVPQDVLAEYESVAREAGFEPGSVLPSTLAALAVVEGEEPVLLVNANDLGVTTAIVRSGVLLLHRSVDLQQHTTEPGTVAGPASTELSGEVAQAVSVAAAYFEDTLASAPQRVFNAGPLGADSLGRILRDQGVASEDGLRVQELVETGALLSGAATSAVPRASLGSVLGALRG